MGLSAAYGILKNHRGTIGVYSEPGHGTTVKIYLPLLGDKIKNIKQDTLKVNKKTASLNILVIDDEKIVCEMIQDMLIELNYSVVIYENGKNALEYYRESWQTVDLVLLDMVMPEMGGQETFIAMREINPDVKVILCSGYSMNDEVQQILNEGVLDFMQKPFQFDEINDAINRVMLL